LDCVFTQDFIATSRKTGRRRIFKAMKLFWIIVLCWSMAAVTTGKFFILENMPNSHA